MKDLQNMIKNPVKIDSLSDYRPEFKNESQYRNYHDSDFIDRVKRIYYDMHSKQTVDFVMQKKEEWCRFDHAEMTIMEALNKISTFIDDSDPDLNLPNEIHAYQTAEKIRLVYPEERWFILVGLIHDIGKVMALYNEVQWAVVGDTYPVGCKFSDDIVFGANSFLNNADQHNNKYNSLYGMYSPNVGLDNVLMSWGHDEYLYQVLKNAEQCKLPDIALKIIRYHSFFSWHQSNAYEHLCIPEDEDTKFWVKRFSCFDLYTKSTNIPNLDEIKPYYENLIEEFIPGTLRW